MKIGEFFAEIKFKADLKKLREAQKVIKQLGVSYKEFNQLMRASINIDKAKTASERAKTAEIRRETAEIQRQNAVRGRSINLHQRESSAIRSSARSISFRAKVVAGALGYGIKSSISNMMYTRNFREFTGVDVGKLQRYSVGAGIIGTSLNGQQIANDIIGLQQGAQGAYYGGGNIAPFQKLGIRPNNQNPVQMIEAMRNAVKNMEAQTALYWIRQIGLSDEWLWLLKATNEELEQYRKLALTDAEAQKITNIGMAFRQLRTIFNQGFLKVVASISETLVNLLNHLRDMTILVSQNQTVMNGFITVLKGVGAAAAIAFAWTHKFTTLLAGALLLWEDWAVFKAGGKSLFNWDMFDEWINKLNSENIFTGILNTIKGIVAQLTKANEEKNKLTSEGDGKKSGWSVFKSMLLNPMKQSSIDFSDYVRNWNTTITLEDSFPMVLAKGFLTMIKAVNEAGNALGEFTAGYQNKMDALKSGRFWAQGGAFAAEMSDFFGGLKDGVLNPDKAFDSIFAGNKGDAYTSGLQASLAGAGLVNGVKWLYEKGKGAVDRIMQAPDSPNDGMIRLGIPGEELLINETKMKAQNVIINSSNTDFKGNISYNAPYGLQTLPNNPYSIGGGMYGGIIDNQYVIWGAGIGK